MRMLLQAGLPQAMLAVGESGTLVSLWCDYLQAAALCFAPSVEGLSCGDCRSCRLLREGNHPDVLVLSAESGKRISIEQIRNANEFMAFTPQVSRRRWLRLEPAESMTTAAANAILKTLEEPAACAHLLCVSQNPSQLLATVRSRLQVLPLPRCQPGACLALLKERGVPHAEALFLSRNFGDRPLRAWQLWESGWLTRRQHWMDAVLALPQAGSIAALRLADAWGKEAELLLLREMMLGLLADLLRVRAGLLDTVVNFDYLHVLQVLAPSADAQRIWETVDAWIHFSGYLTQNRNTGLLLETLLLNWMNLWSKEKRRGSTK